MAFRRKRCIAIVEGTVYDMFATFVNPANKGPNFTWGDFPEMMASLIKRQLFLSLPNVYSQADPSKKEVEFSSQYARDLATRLIKRAGLIDTSS